MSYYTNKTLPTIPVEPSHKEVERLKSRIRFLDEVIEILYKQNLQYSLILKRQRDFESQLEVKIQRMVRVAMNVAALQSNN